MMSLVFKRKDKFFLDWIEIHVTSESVYIMNLYFFWKQKKRRLTDRNSNITTERKTIWYNEYLDKYVLRGREINPAKRTVSKHFLKLIICIGFRTCAMQHASTCVCVIDSLKNHICGEQDYCLIVLLTLRKCFVC